MILAIRTDKPTAELYLYLDNQQKASLKWQADRNLSRDIHNKLNELFSTQNIDYSDLKGIVFYKGPGSFTGLRIGASVANTISSELDMPIAGGTGSDWVDEGLQLLTKSPKTRTIIPEYGAEPNTSKPKK